MKKLAFFTLAVILTLTSSCSDDTADEIQVDTISQQEKDDLLFMREEEKLARDVYLFSYDKYGEAIFNNIARSEQQHMDQMLTLINTYKLNDPASSDRGVFSNQVLQELYNELTAQSSSSLDNALVVGATIEDLDIKDLDEAEDKTDKADILNTYDKLKCGSRNHLRSYISRLEVSGVIYIPQFISLDEFNEIINSQKESCN